MNKLKYFFATTLICLITMQNSIGLAATSEWTDKPEFKDYKIGQRLILKVRDEFLNTSEQEVFSFKYEGKEYENINSKNPVFVTNGINKKQLLIEAMTLHNEIEKKVAEAEGRNPVLKDLNNLEEEDFLIETTSRAIVSFDENGVLKVNGNGAFNITFEEKGKNKVYIYFMEASQGIRRISGTNRIETSINIAKETFKGKVRNVIIATSENYPDALSGSVLANKLEAPILLVGNSRFDVEKVLSYMKDKMELDGNIYILGGYGAVSKDIEKQINNAGFTNIKRISGIDRYETSAKISSSLLVKEGTPIILAQGEGFADALSVSSVAAAKQYPILLVEKDKIPDYAKKKLSAIKPGKVFIIGLQCAISENVEKELSNLNINKSNIVRIGGSDRYETSIETAKYFNLDGRCATVATGKDFPDALSGSVYAAKYNASLILCNDELNENTKAYLKNKGISNIAILGGENVVSINIEKKLVDIFKIDR